MTKPGKSTVALARRVLAGFAHRLVAAAEAELTGEGTAHVETIDDRSARVVVMVARQRARTLAARVLARVGLDRRKP